MPGTLQCLVLLAHKLEGNSHRIYTAQNHKVRLSNVRLKHLLAHELNSNSLRFQEMVSHQVVSHSVLVALVPFLATTHIVAWPAYYRYNTYGDHFKQSDCMRQLYEPLLTLFSTGMCILMGGASP